jgi:hypothetical protein
MHIVPFPWTAPVYRLGARRLFLVPTGYAVIELHDIRLRILQGPYCTHE